MEPKVYTGRPSKNVDFKFYDGPLHRLLVAKLPSVFIKGGRVDTESIRLATGNARFTVYRWLNEQTLSKKAIQSLLLLSESTDEAAKKAALTKEDLYPFLGL